MDIRPATPLDRNDIYHIHWSAFAADEREMVAKLAVDLLFEKTSPRTVSLVAESEGIIVGHTAFSPVTIENNENCRGYILAPLGVKPDYQKRRIGSKLIAHGLQQLSDMKVNIVLVYGNPEYYGRFGFKTDTAEHYRPPYPLEYPFGWQGIVLNEYSSGTLPAATACVTSLRDPALW